MKVLFVCPFVPWPLENGGKIRTFHLVREAARHVEVHLRLVREPGGTPGAEEALAPHCASLELHERSSPGPVRRLARPKLERWFHSESLRASLAASLATGDFDLVHLDELLLSRSLPPGTSVPVVQHHHKLDTVLYDLLWSHAGATKHFDLWKLRRLERESTRRTPWHLFCSQGDADFLQGRHGGLFPGVVPSGFDPASFAPATPPAPREPGRLLFLGSMDYGPNVDGVGHFVRETLPRIVAAEPRTRLDIVGSVPPAEVRALEDGHVHVTGRVPEVRPFLEKAAAMVVPLRIGGGTRLKIVEALALETPVVSTAVGAEGLGLADGEHLRLADDPEGFAAATLALLAEPEAAARLARQGRDHVQRHYRWEVLGEALVTYWRRAAAAGTRTRS